MTNSVSTTMLHTMVLAAEDRAFRPRVHPDLLWRSRARFFPARRTLQRLRQSIVVVPERAYFIKEDISPSGAQQQLYRLSEPLWSWSDEPADAAEYVLVSAVFAMISGPETYIFAANPEGEVLSWSDLPGSFQGARNHEEALRGAGYRIAT